MATSNNDASILQLKICSYCSKAVEKEGDKLLRCSRCLRVAYCNKDCQTSHWKGEHKHHCGKPNQEGSALRNGSVPSMRTIQEPEKFGFIDITVTTPGIDDVSGCCALCAILTLADGENQMFFVPEPIRVDMMTRLNGGVEPYPTNMFRLIALQHEQLNFDSVPYPEPKNNYMRRLLSAGPGGNPPATSEVGCCRYCACKFHEVLPSPLLQQTL